MRPIVRRASIFLIAAALTAGCAGPKAKLTFGGKAVPINVAFGSPKKGDPGAVTGPLVLQSGPGGIGVVPVPVGSPTTLTTQNGDDNPSPPQATSPCPEMDPFKFPLAGVEVQVNSAAPMGSFLYRVVSNSTQDGKTRSFRGQIIEQVADAVKKSDGSFSYSTQSRGPNGVVTKQSFVAQPATDALPGLVGLVAEQATVGQQDYFFVSQAKPLKLLPLRATPGESWDDVVHDPRTQTTITVQGQTVGVERINACGQPIDSFKVSTTEDVVTPNQHLTLTVTRWIATQYGGLVVAESYSYHGTVTAGNKTISGDYSAIINRDPSVVS